MGRQEEQGSVFARLAMHMGTKFALGMGVYFAMLYVPKHGWAEGLVTATLTGLGGGIAFGLAMAWLVGRKARKASALAGADPLEVHQRRHVEVHGTPQDVLRRVEAAMRGLPKAKRTTVHAADRVVHTRTGWSWQSFGEVVEARVQPADASTCGVYIESRPRVKTTLVDYGVNAINVDTVVAALQA